MSDKIKVAIKVRRLIDREEFEGLVSQWEVKNNSLFQKDSTGKYRESYSFDHVFGPQTKNYEVFNTVARPIVDSSVSGFNGTIFAYGQTSSGKTYTMMGNQHEPGIIPQTIQYIFEALNKVQGREFLLRASYIEIYNEKVNDLLEKGKTGLKLREVEGTTIICGVKEEVVHTPDKIMQLMKRGENIRRIGETNMNERSSRSHTIFRIIIESRVPNEGEDGVVQVSHLNLVDLAGSERLDQTGAKGDRLKEGCSINRSLFMLSHVISQLSEGQDQYVNFRDSKLTRILQSSLGGNAHTAIICAVTPASVEETSSTLGFASRAINVKNKPHINEVLSDAALLKRYARQIAKLQTELEKTKNRNKTYEVEEIESKLQEEQRRNELLQERIDLMKEQLIGSAATDSAGVDKRRALRRRTWCGHASRKSLFPIAPSLQTIDENSTNFLEQECLSTAIQDLANKTFFETPLEEFELQLMDAETILSPDSLDTPCHITFRKEKRQCVTFDDEPELTDNHSKKTMEIGSQTEALPINFHGMNTEYGTPPHILRERVAYIQQEYDELREFTTLEKQICNPVLYKEVTDLERQNKQLQKSMSDLERMVLDVNCINSKINEENKSLKERLAKETEKCNDMACRLQPAETALLQVSQEVVDLKKQLNVATQRVKHLENERNDFEMIQELALARLKTRNKELSLSLEDAQMKLKELAEEVKSLETLKQNTENLCALQGRNMKCIEQLQEKANCHENLQQQCEEVKEGGSKSQELSSVYDELKVLSEVCLMCIEKLKEKNEYLERLKQTGEADLTFTDKLQKKDTYLEQLEEQIEDLKERALSAQELCREKDLNAATENNLMSAELKAKNVTVQKENNSLEEQNSLYKEQLRQRDNCLETMKEQIEEENCERQASVTYIGELKAHNISLQREIKVMQENNSVFMRQLREKDYCLETMKQQLKDLDCQREANLTYIEELKANIVSLKKEIHSLEEEYSRYSEEVKGKDNYFHQLKKHVEDMNLGKETNLKYIDELETNNVSLQMQIHSLKEKNSLNVEQVKEKDNYLATLKQEVADLNCAREANLKYIDELKANIASMRTEIHSLEETNSIHGKQMKEKDSYLETLKREIADLNCTREANLKYIDELKANIASMRTEIHSLEETNSIHGKQMKEKNSYLETLKQEIADLNCTSETNLIYVDKLKANSDSLQKEITLLKEENSVYREQLGEMDNYLETVKQEIENDSCTRETNLKDVDEWISNESMEKGMDSIKVEDTVYRDQLNSYGEALERKIEDMKSGSVANFKYIDELQATNVSLQREINSLEEKNCVYIEKLSEKDNYLEGFKKVIEDIHSSREGNLKYIDELETNNVSLQMQIHSLEEKNSVYMEQMKEKDNYLQTMKQQIDNLNCASEANLNVTDKLKAKNECLKKQIISLEEKNFVYMGQLKEKDSYLETAKQQIEDLKCSREGNLEDIDELKSKIVILQKEIIYLEENNSLYMEQIKEKDNYLEVMKQQIEDLNCGRETNFKDIDDLKTNNESLQKEVISLEEKNSVCMEQLKEKDIYLETMKQQIEDLNCGREANFKDIDELKSKIVILQKEIIYLEENNSLYMEQIKEKDNYLEVMKQQIGDLNCGRETNFKDIDDLKTNNESLQKEIISLEEKNFVYMGQLKEKDSYLETAKQQIEDLKCSREGNLEDIDELKSKIVILQKEIIYLEENNSLYMEQIKEKDNYLEVMKQQIEDLNCGRETNFKDIDELKTNIDNLQKEVISLEEKNSLYMEQFKEKDIYLETMKQQIEDLNCGREANFKDIDELKSKIVILQKEIIYLEENNSLYMEQIKEKDNYLEVMKQQIEDLNCGRETNFKDIDELKTNIDNLQKEVISLEEKNSLYMEQFKEKDIYLETMKQQIEDLNCGREANFKDIDELKSKIVILQKEIIYLEENNSLYMEQIKEKDNYLEVMKQQIEDLNCGRETNFKDIDELKTNIDNLQKEVISLEEKNSLYMEQFKEKDNYLEAMQQQIEDLNCGRETNLEESDELKTNTEILQKEIISLEGKNSVYMKQLKEKDNYLETMKQQIENLNYAREAILNVTDELKAKNDSLKKEIISLEEKNSLYMEQLKEKENYLEAMKQQIEDLNCGRETKLKVETNESLQKGIISLEEINSLFVEQLKQKDNYLEVMKQQIEDLNCGRETNLKDIDDLKTNNESLQKEIISLKEKNSMYMEQVKEKDNYLETMKQQIEDLNYARETNLKYADDLETNIVSLQMEIHSLEEKNSVYLEQLKERDNYLETMKQHIEDLNCGRETNFNHIDELRAKNECLQKEIISLEDKNSVCMEQLKEKDNYLVIMKQQIEDLHSGRETTFKDIDELKTNIESLQKEVVSLEEKNSVYMEQLKEKNNYLATLKQGTENLNSEREEILKYTDELKTNIVSLQTEINALQENNSMYVRQVREMDNNLETLKQQLKDLDCQREANLTYIDELKANIVSLKKEIHSLEEDYSRYSEEVKGKDNYLQELKKHVEDMNSGRDTNLKYIDELETNNVSLQMQIHSLKEKNSLYVEQVKEKDNYLEILKQETADLNCAREANLKYIDELKANIASMMTEIHSLGETNSMHGKQMKEKVSYLETLKREIADLNCAREANLEYIDEVNANISTMQTDIHSLREKNAMHLEQLKKKDNYLGVLKQQIEDLNCAREQNLKDVDELRANNECLQKEIISLEEKNSVYMEQLKEKDNYLETLKQEFEDIGSERATILGCSDEQQINSRMGKEMNFITEENTLYREQLKEKDSYIEALKQQIEDMNSVNKTNLICIKQLHDQNKCCESLKYEKEPKSQEYGVLGEQVVCSNTQVPADLSMLTRSLSSKSQEIELCRNMMLKEVSDLKPEYDVESQSQSQLTDLLKILLTFVMEKELEMFHSLQDQMNEIHTQANETEKEYAKKDKEKGGWIRELEAEIEHLQVCVARVEEEKKTLEMDDKSHLLQQLQQERNDLIKKLRQLECDLVILQLERNRVESDNKEMVQKLEDLQLLLEEKSSQLQEELEIQFNKSQTLETLMKKVSDLEENNAVLLERLEKTDNGNRLLLKKVEDLECALMLKENENLDIARKLGSLEMELKVLTMKNFALEEEVTVSKEVHSLALKEKEHCSEITLNLKRVTEDVENLRVQKLAWDCEKEQLQAKLAEMQKELTLERDIQSNLEKDMMTNVQKVKEENNQLQVSYSHLLQNYEMLKGEVNHSHLTKQVHSLNVSDCMSQKSEITVTEPDENLLLKKQLEEKLEKQKELSRENEILATRITGLKEEVSSLRNENVRLREAVKILNAEENRLHALMCIKESEIEVFKRQLEKIVHEKAALLVACKCIQEPMQQPKHALVRENKENSSSVSENGSYTENLHLRHPFSARVAHSMAEERGTDVSEKRKLEEQLKICMEEKMAVTNENERLVADISDLQKKLERYCVENNSLGISLETLEEEKKRLESQLIVSHKRLLDAESEVQELKLKTVAMRKDEAAQENSVLRFRIKRLEAEIEHHKMRKNPLLKESHSAGHNIGKRGALCCHVQSQLTKTASVLKSSVATNTDISGSCQCKELTEKVNELKITNAQQKNMIGNLNLQIRAEEFPYQQKVKELEERVSFYKSKNMELRTDLRHLNNVIKDSGCDSSGKLLQARDISVQTDEVKDEDYLFTGAGGSGIIREDQLIKMRIKVHNLEAKYEKLKEICRERRRTILDLEEKLKIASGSQKVDEKENCDSGQSKDNTKQISGAGSSRRVGLTRYNWGFGSDDICGQSGNKENFPGRDEAL